MGVLYKAPVIPSLFNSKLKFPFPRGRGEGGGVLHQIFGKLDV